MTEVSCPVGGQFEVLLLISWLSVILILLNPRL